MSQDNRGTRDRDGTMMGHVTRQLGGQTGTHPFRGCPDVPPVRENLKNGQIVLTPPSD